MDWNRRAEWLAFFTIGYNFIEGLVSMIFGVREQSMALAGFGAQSFIEVGSALVVLWRLRGRKYQERERSAVQMIGVLFLFLAAVTAMGSGFQIWRHHPPDTTLPGIVISLISLSFMGWLWQAKLEAGQMLKSSTVLGDAACSLACIKLSGVLLVGSCFYAVIPSLWWVDSIAALVLCFFIAREGNEMLRGEDGCGCSGTNCN